MTPSLLSGQQPTIDTMFQQPISAQIPVAVMSLEQAILEWIINTLQPFVAVEHLLFRWMFECIQHQLPLQTGNVVRNRIISQLDDYILSLKDELELA